MTTNLETLTHYREELKKIDERIAELKSGNHPQWDIVSGGRVDTTEKDVAVLERQRTDLVAVIVKYEKLVG